MSFSFASTDIESSKEFNTIPSAMQNNISQNNAPVLKNHCPIFMDTFNLKFLRKYSDIKDLIKKMLFKKSLQYAHLYHWMKWHITVNWFCVQKLCFSWSPSNMNFFGNPNELLRNVCTTRRITYQDNNLSQKKKRN